MNPYRSSGLEKPFRSAYNHTMPAAALDMNPARKLARFATCLVFAFAAQASIAAVVDDAPEAATSAPQVLQIYQQRTADGKVVLTDRPAAGAVTQRTWKMAPEDPVAALQRREQALADATAVSDRIQRRIDADTQRDHELTLARIQAASEQARLNARLARAATQEPASYFAPGYFSGFAHRPPHHRPRNPQVQPPRSRHPTFGMSGSRPG